ncbi:MAG: hypothetical protein ACRBEQ_03900 [Hyphomonas sp.]
MILSFFKRSKSKPEKVAGSRPQTHGFSTEQLTRIQALAHERLQRAENLAVRSFPHDTPDTHV